MNLGLDGHVAIVTGGGRGIGAAIARALGAEGCRLAIWDRDLEPAAEVVSGIVAAGGEAEAYQVDVARSESVRKAADRTLERFGHVHVLVNNAGFSLDAPITEMTEEQWDTVMNVCLKGTFLCTQAVVPTMIANTYGRIVNIASRGHLGSEPNKSNYAAAKGGVVSFTKALAHELGRKGITVNAVAPGFTLTDRLRSLPHYAQLEARATAAQPIGRPGLPEDQARGVLFLASPAADYISGEVLYITGGRFG